MNPKIILFVCTSLFFISCKKEMKTEDVITDTIVSVTHSKAVEMHNSQNSLDWSGTYKGVTPCADCEGIETEVILNSDLTFVIKTKYLSKGDGKTFEESGSFTWDKSGENISLDSLKGRPSQYKVGENQLIQLDMEGNVISGQLAEKYVLTKK